MTSRSFFLAILAILLISTYSARGQSLLWQIGRSDDNAKEFALAPDGYKDFKRDPFYVVGRSTDSLDWVFCHPGPDDAWAGNQSHTYTILFAVTHKPAAGATCHLRIKTVDAGHRDIQLLVHINGRLFMQHLPEGAAKSIHGDMTEGKHQSLDIAFPSELLVKGNNTIDITNARGSWLVYDWLGLECPASVQQAPVGAAISLAGIIQDPVIAAFEGREYQPARVILVNSGIPRKVTVAIPGLAPQSFTVPTGRYEAAFRMPAVGSDSTVEVRLHKGSAIIGRDTVTIHPVKRMTVYILPHSHNDIGYTEIQSKVEEKQLNNLLTGIEYAKKTKDYPAGARFVWNLEGLYAADLFLQRMTETQKKDFYDAVQNGGVAFNGMYLNTLTGLCRPEELINLFKFSTSISKQFQVKTESAMISDVPGYTWGTVAAMNQAGIKYFSAAPNYFDRIGDILQQWEDKPFYWLSPSGKEKLLVWIPWKGYALSHTLSHPDATFVTAYMQQLKRIGFPYDISYIRWSGHGDNAVPDPEISEFVRDWNSKYSWPHFIISSTTTAFRAFEERYGSQLPTYQGDWTGYWEDGAGSSAYETAENRTTSSRLTQAGTLWALNHPATYPAKKFEDAWRHVILYSEHTWGADMSVTNPLAQKTKEQWEIKKGYATTADTLSSQLLAAAVAGTAAAPNTVDVYNTNSWRRSSLVTIPAAMSKAGDQVQDAGGKFLPAQRLTTGELAFIATDLAPFSAKRYTVVAGSSKKGAAPSAPAGQTLDNGIISVTVDPVTGAISSIRRHGYANNFADSVTGANLNEYLFLPGKDLADLQKVSSVTITRKEAGPVVSSLLITSEAPGCNKLTREIRLSAGADYVEMINVLDKRPAELNPHPGDYAWANTGGKESVHFGFPFHVPEGTMHIDIPMAIMQPEKDQIPGSCKNWLETGSWADVSNHDLGITWATLDAPLVEVGGVTANLLGGQTNPDVWRKKIEPTQKLYSWAINNHWETNYRAYQDGLITFRYALRPHGVYDPVEATRFATGLTQPLIVAPATGQTPLASGLSLGSDKLIAIAFRPTVDGTASLLTLFNPTAAEQTATIQWNEAKAIYYSNTTEITGDKVSGPIPVAAQDIVTLRIQR